MASKVLLMSNVTRSVLCGGLSELMPSKILCVRFVRRVFVECSDLKPCCDSARGIYGVTRCRIRRSMILEGEQRSVIGRCDAGTVGSLLGLGIVIIFPCFQMLGKMLCE